ncbi:MAG: ParB/RepB/Spo0J family partition protein [Chloroflexi bacterium]|nr:ParB/RepB/Spo0J family partition protein [Chloroflexota bacterium]
MSVSIPAVAVQELGLQPPTIPAMVSIWQIEPNPWQPRQNFELAGLLELAEDIKENGLLQPVMVRPKPGFGNRPFENQIFELALGERRLRAYRLLYEGYTLSEEEQEDVSRQYEKLGYENNPDRDKWLYIPAQIRELTDRKMMQIVYSENAKRSDVSPLEEAIAFQRMLRDLSIKQKDLGHMLNVSQATISNRMRMLKLPDSVQLSILQGKLGQGHAIKLLEIAAGRTEAPHVGRAWVELIAKSLVSGEIPMQNFSSNQYIWNLFKLPGVIDLHRSGAKFSVAEACKDCQFFYGNPTDVGYAEHKLCANAAKFHERNTAAIRAEQEAEETAAEEAKRLAEQAGKQLLRSANGRLLQNKAEFDEVGVPIIEQTYGLLNYEEYKSFGLGEYNGFDTAECVKCQWYAKAKNSGNYLCLQPAHFKKLHSAHAREIDKNAKAAGRVLGEQFRQGYAANMLMGKFAWFDKPTAVLLAKEFMGKINESNKDLLKVAQQWLEKEGLSSLVTKNQKRGEYYGSCTTWVDEEIERMGREGDDNYNQIITKAIACIVESFLLLSKGNKAELPTWVQDYLNQVLEDGKEKTNGPTAAVQAEEVAPIPIPVLATLAQLEVRYITLRNKISDLRDQERNGYLTNAEGKSHLAELVREKDEIEPEYFRRAGIQSTDAPVPAQKPAKPPEPQEEPVTKATAISPATFAEGIAQLRASIESRIKWHEKTKARSGLTDYQERHLEELIESRKVPDLTLLDLSDLHRMEMTALKTRRASIQQDRA